MWFHARIDLATRHGSSALIAAYNQGNSGPPSRSRDQVTPHISPEDVVRAVSRFPVRVVSLYRQLAAESSTKVEPLFHINPVYLNTSPLLKTKRIRLHTRARAPSLSVPPHFKFDGGARRNGLVEQVSTFNRLLGGQACGSSLTVVPGTVVMACRVSGSCRDSGCARQGTIHEKLCTCVPG